MSEQPKPLAEDVRDWTENDYREVFGTRGESFRRGYAAGSADTTARMLRTLRLVTAVLERNLGEDVAIAAGDEPPLLN